MNNVCLHGNKTKIKHTLFSLPVSGGVSLVSFCHIFIRIRRLFAVNVSFPERNSRDFSVSLSQAYFIPIYEIVAKAKSSKKTTDRWCIEKLMKIKHDCLLKKERKRISDCLPIWKEKKKVTIKITKGFPSLSLTKKECEVSDSVSWEVAVSALREPQIISLWDLGAEFFFFYARASFSLKTLLVGEKKIGRCDN